MKNLSIFVLFVAMIAACNQPASNGQHTENASAPDTLRYEQETHLENMRQLTFGGDNAEAYFSFDNKFLTLQVTNEEWGTSCDQIFYMPVEGTNGKRPQLISTGKGNTTCSFFLPGNQQIIYASTHLAADTCLSSPRVVDGKYDWAVHKEFDIFVAVLKCNTVKP